MSRTSPISSPNRAVVALVPAEHEWQPVLHVSNQVVLYNPHSHALSITRSNNPTGRLNKLCPYCKQSLPDGFERQLDDDDDIDALDSDPAYHSRASDYFQLLAISNEAMSRPSTPPPPPPSHEPSSTFPADKMAEGYFKAFFQEEMKLGMGANGSVYLCQNDFIIQTSLPTSKTSSLLMKGKSNAVLQSCMVRIMPIFGFRTLSAHTPVELNPNFSTILLTDGRTVF
ncbi:hypothetical protein H0H93_014627 [Arthromyces matolae]|nr:hypothetical protein H0H93_014627 [Arthromyces matolae]